MKVHMHIIQIPLQVHMIHIPPYSWMNRCRKREAHEIILSPTGLSTKHPSKQLRCGDRAMASLIADEDHVVQAGSLCQPRFQRGPHTLDKLSELAGLRDHVQHREAFSPVYGGWSSGPHPVEEPNVVDEWPLDGEVGFEVTGQGSFVTGLEG